MFISRRDQLHKEVGIELVLDKGETNLKESISKEIVHLKIERQEHTSFGAHKRLLYERNSRP